MDDLIPREAVKKALRDYWNGYTLRVLPGMQGELCCNVIDSVPSAWPEEGEYTNCGIDAKNNRKMTIGEKLSAYCDRNRISHFEFAVKAGMTTVSIGRLTTNNLPNVMYLMNIAKVLGEDFGSMMKEHYEALAERNGKQDGQSGT